MLVIFSNFTTTIRVKCIFMAINWWNLVNLVKFHSPFLAALTSLMKRRQGQNQKASLTELHFNFAASFTSRESILILPVKKLEKSSIWTNFVEKRSKNGLPKWPLVLGFRSECPSSSEERLHRGQGRRVRCRGHNRAEVHQRGNISF